MLGDLNLRQIEDVLHAAKIGRIGCIAEGRPYVVPVTYAYDGADVYAHSAVGMKVRAMRAHPDVCFEVEDVDGLSAWRSVIAWGRYEELEGVNAERGMKILIDRFMPMMTSATATPTHGLGPGEHRPAVIFRLRLVEKTGRYEKR